MQTLATRSFTAAPAPARPQAWPDLGLEAELARALELVAKQRSRIAQLESEALTDPLTGCLNRRGFSRALNRELERGRRAGAASALLVLFDLDGLKAVNDSYGHAAGDALIGALADGLRNGPARLRGSDYVARLGGDEFAVLMTDGDPMQLRRRADALAAALNATNVPTLNVPLRVSHGCATVQPSHSDLAIMTEADVALYVCKGLRKPGRQAAAMALKSDNAHHCY